MCGAPNRRPTNSSELCCNIHRFLLPLKNRRLCMQHVGLSARADGLSKEEIEEAEKMTAVLMANVQQDSCRMLGRDSPFAFASQTGVNPASLDQLLKEVVTVVNTGIAVHRRNKLSRRNGKKNGRPLSITQRAMEDAMGEKLLLVGRYLAICGDDVKL